MEVPVIEFFVISGLLDYSLICFLISQLVILYSQVENSSTAQVGGPQDAASVVEPALAGSDVPLPEDGFTHEVIVSVTLFLRAAHLMLFLSGSWINADYLLAHVIMVLFLENSWAQQLKH